MKKRIFQTVIVLLALAVALPLMAADTGQINYQARLLDSYGRRLNTTVNLSFKIYDAVTAGNLLWSETQTGVVVQDGVYSVVLGSQTAIPASVFAQNNIYLELGINGETMTPRQQITASGYSLVARTIMGSNVYENQDSGYLGVGTTNPAVKLDVSGTIQATGLKIPTGATANYVLASDANGVGTWQPYSSVVIEHDPIHTNWVKVVYTPATNSIWYAIGAESTTRAAADTTLQNNIDTEAATRAAADTTLQNNINTEATTRATDITAASNALNTAVVLRMFRSGDIMTGPLTNEVLFAGNGAGLTNIPDSGLVSTSYVKKVGDTMTGVLVVSNNVTVTGTNQVGVLYVTNSIILRDEAAITNWQGLTNTFNPYYISSSPGKITNDNISAGGVGLGKIAENAVADSNIIQGAVTLGRIANNAVDSSNIIDGAVTSAEIGQGAVILGRIANDAVASSNIIQGAVTIGRIANDAVASSNIIQGAVTIGRIANNAVADSNIISAANWNNAVVIKIGTKDGGDTVAYSNVYCFSAGTTWSNACATNSTSAGGLLGIALGTTITGDGLLLNGQCTNAGWGFTPGAILYLATNYNGITQTRPFGTNHIVRIVGYAIDTTNIYFNPDRTYIEILGD